MWQWANQPRPSRLLAQRETGDWIRFVDTHTGEVARCNACPDQLHNLSVEVWKPGATGAPPNLTHAIARTDALSFRRGSGVMRRDVWHYVTREHTEALRVGLTVHWSYFSSTPHAFELNPEKGFEEVFYFVVDDKAFLEGEGLWPNGDRVDAAWPVRTGQFAQVPMGYHRVIGAARPDNVLPEVAYIWCYLCLKPEWEKDEWG